MIVVQPVYVTQTKRDVGRLVRDCPEPDPVPP